MTRQALRGYYNAEIMTEGLMKKIVLLIFTSIFLFGCAGFQERYEEAGRQLDRDKEKINETIPICVNDRDCKEKWSAAQVWVSRNCGMKIQMVTDSIIQTHNSCDGCTELACIVTKEPTGNGKYRFLISLGCDNMWACDLNERQQATLNFNEYVNSIGSNDQNTSSNAPKVPFAVIQKDATNEKLKFGIKFVKTNEKASQILGMKEPHGVVVVSVVQDSVAFKAGLKQGDVILKYGKKVINDEPDLQAAIAATKSGSRIPITIWDIHRGEIVITAHFPK